MPIGAPYVATAELKARLNISDSGDDAALAEAVAAASRHVELYCHRQFNDAGSVSARTFRPSVLGCFVHVHDFSTATGLIVKTDDDDDGVFETTWTGADFELEPADGIKDGVPGWPFTRLVRVGSRRFPELGRRSVQVTARWGWAQVPQPVREASLILAEELWKLKDAPFGVAGFGQFGSVRVRENPKVASLLKEYRRAGVRVAG
ncbi:phage head-tail connector protein [Streptomyces sp. NPDC001774]